MDPNLGPSGRAIWEAYGADKLPAGFQALILELARCADTCDRLDGLAAGRHSTWIELAFDDMGELHITVDKVLELRLKHQIALKAIHSEVRAAKIGAEEDGAEAGPKDMLAELRKQKEERERQSG